jgi:uncharacterized membrane protein YkoI
MSMVSKLPLPIIITAGLVLSGIGAVPAAQDGTAVTPEAQATVIPKALAEAIAVKAIGGGTVVAAVLDKEDGQVHWSVDIRGATSEYEVWVSTAGKVLKIMTEPL